MIIITAILWVVLMSFCLVFMIVGFNLLLRKEKTTRITNLKKDITIKNLNANKYASVLFGKILCIISLIDIILFILILEFLFPDRYLITLFLVSILVIISMIIPLIIVDIKTNIKFNNNRKTKKGLI